MADHNGLPSRLLRRIAGERDLDLYVLATGAFAFTILGATGYADALAIYSAILGLLTVLAIAQVRSRRQVAALSDAKAVDPMAVLRSDFPGGLVDLRQEAQDLLLIGRSLDRTVTTGRYHLQALLARGGRLRILTVDPNNDFALSVAAGLERGDIEELRSSIQVTLRQLVRMKVEVGGNLEIRVSNSVPLVGVNAIDSETRSGTIVAQHYEYRPRGESLPIVRLAVEDGHWYGHYLAHAERLWADGIDWSPMARVIQRSPRPMFADQLEASHMQMMFDARHLFVSGVTRNSFITDNYGKLEQLLIAGGAVRFLLIDPDSSAIPIVAERYYAHRSPGPVRQRIRHSLTLIQELQAATGGDISVKWTKYPLGLGTVIARDVVEIGDDYLFAEYYTYQASGEPKFILKAGDDGWFEHFASEAELLWDQGEPVSSPQ